MNSLVKLLKGKKTKEVNCGVVREVIQKDFRAKIELEGGTNIYVRYSNVLTDPAVGDVVLVGGDKIKYVVQAAEGTIPKNNLLLKV